MLHAEGHTKAIRLILIERSLEAQCLCLRLFEQWRSAAKSGIAALHLTQ